jgi:hypothetical protein
LLFSFLHGPVRGSGPGRSGPRSRTVHGPVRSTGRHGTGRHGPFSGERRTDPPLDRTVIGHGPVHGPATVRYGPVHGHGPVRDGSDRPVHFNTLPYAVV